MEPTFDRGVTANQTRRKPMKITIMAVAALIFLATAGFAEASSARYCLRTSAGPGDCRFSTMKQCRAASSGIGGTCVRNYGRR
jgi:hypothetical protein